jgi:predicted Zn finger-like uncharacterized protein
MDVRCERCRTEYEFDDAKISDAGVTVRCTVCSHVFKVKGRSIAPVDAATLVAPLPSRALAVAREWTVRQADGKQFSFRELTTLQKWIVERKVVRTDEITLTGGSWKRLGNIAELASFFQVVEAADRGAAMSAAPVDRGSALTEEAAGPLQLVQGPAFAPTSPSLPAQFAAGAPAPERHGRSAPMPLHPPSPGMWRDGREDREPLSAPEPVVAPAGAATTADPEAAPAPTEPPVAGLERSAAWEGGAPVASASSAAEPAWSQAPQPLSSELDAAEIAAIRGGGTFKYLAVGLFGVLLIGVTLWFFIWQPSSSRPAPEMEPAPATLPATVAPEAKVPEPAAPPAKPPSAVPAAEPRVDPAVAVASGKPAEAATPRLAPRPRVGEADPGEPKAAGTPAKPAAPAMSKPNEPAPRLGEEEPGATRVAEARKPAAPVAPAPPGPPAGVRPFDWYVQQGLHLRDRGQSQPALEMYDKADALDAQSAEPPTGKGYCLLDQGRHEASIAQFQEALRRNGRFHDAILGLAEAYKERGDKAKAIETYKRYLEEAPDGPEASLARTTIERLSGN